MAIAAYVTYELFWLSGEGHQPYSAIQQQGMSFDGGLYQYGNKYFGYLKGDITKKNTTIAACSAFSMVELTSAEALYWAEQSIPVNTQNKEGLYLSPTSLDGNGYIVRTWSEESWGNANNI
jgi:hypothetical protein